MDMSLSSVTGFSLHPYSIGGVLYISSPIVCVSPEFQYNANFEISSKATQVITSMILQVSAM